MHGKLTAKAYINMYAIIIGGEKNPKIQKGKTARKCVNSALQDSIRNRSMFSVE
jgi:hypothetical protein